MPCFTRLLIAGSYRGRFQITRRLYPKFLVSLLNQATNALYRVGNFAIQHIADEKLKAVERIIQGRGFVTIPETLNATEAWLSSIPGHAYANIRHPLVSTLNLAHMMPVSAVWAGPEKNAHLDAPPLIVTRTAGGTPFRLVTHIDDVGHTLIVGPTGAGKSVLLAVLALQFRRYAGSRIFIFDKGGSARATILGLGGEHYDLGSSASIAFQPLAGIDHEETRAWAAEWIAGLLGHEHVEITPDVKDAVWSAVTSLASAHRPLNIAAIEPAAPGDATLHTVGSARPPARCR